MRVAPCPFGMPVHVISPSSISWMTGVGHREVEAVLPNLGGTSHSSSAYQGMYCTELQYIFRSWHIFDGSNLFSNSLNSLCRDRVTQILNFCHHKRTFITL